MAKSKKNNTEEQLMNLQAAQLAAQVANWAAQLDFQKERFRLLEMPQFQQGMQLEVDKLAWQKAQDTWERSYQEALVTGYYNDMPTAQWLMDQARLTGSFQGERTLEGRLTDAQIKDMNDKMKLANDQFLAATTGYFNGQKTFDREKFESAQAMDGWKFLATLTGPQNAFKQARAIATTPGGLNQMMQAFAGQYMLPSSSTVGSGGRASLADLTLGARGNFAAGPYTPPPGAVTAPAATYAAPAGPGGESQGLPYQQPENMVWATGAPQSDAAVQTGVAAPTAQGYQYSPPGVQAPVGAWNYSATQDGSVAAYPPGVVSPAQTGDVSSTTPLNPASVSPMLSAPYQYQAPGTTAPQTQTETMTAPNQINAVNYNNAYQYQKDLMWAAYEDAGTDKGLAQESFLKSLPKYGGPTKGSVVF